MTLSKGNIISDIWHNDVYTTVKDSRKCARNKPAGEQRRFLQLFPPKGAFDLLAMGILGPLTKRLDGNQFVLLIMVRCPKLARALPKFRTTASYIVSLL